MNPLKSLWEPTKQTEQHWRSAIREESLKWEEGGEEDRVVTVTDPDDGFVSWNLNIPKGPACDDSETFTVPEGEGQWLTSSHDEPMELPTSVPWPPPQLHGPAEKNCPLHYIATSFSGAPSYDDEGSDGDWKPWAAEIVKERSVRVHSCFGLVVYLQRSPEWAKTPFSRR